MFENRLKWFSILLAVVAGVIALRLGEIQILRAGEYEAAAKRILDRPLRYLRAVRGSILDRRGIPLVEDIGAFDIGVHYAVLTIGDGSNRDLSDVARQLRRGKGRVYSATTPTARIVGDLRGHLEEMWQRLSVSSGEPVDKLMQRGEAICRRVARIRAAVARRNRGRDQPVAEENMFHALLEGVSDELAVALRMELSEFPWVRVMPGSRRVTRATDAFAHILGRMGAVSERALKNDPLREERRRKLRPGERCGVSGVERAGEAILRGTRGEIRENFGGAVIERVDQERGSDVTLTIDADLQWSVLEILGRHVEQSMNPAGGAAVVIDAQSREILAMASYPTFKMDEFNQRYAELSRDTRRMPLLSRCVAAQYPPGSICKLATLYGALADGKVSEHSEIECRGYLYSPTSYRCWIYKQYNYWHGGLIAEEAIKHSCNIFFYTVGERLGAERLCHWFAEFGLGKRQGTGLIDETAGILPTPAWLFHNRGRTPEKSDARNFAIGQGEVTATPLQAANAAATVATGRWAPVKLFRGDLRAPKDPVERVMLRDGPIALIRRGMTRVVNENGGTAEYARLDHPDFVICGKTGSAQTSRRVLARDYTVQIADGSRQTVRAVSKADALAQVDDSSAKILKSSIAELFPDRLTDPSPSHAWFIGFTQPAGTPLGQRPSGRVYAIAVIIEYGGSGGRVAGPLAKAIAEAVLAREDL